MKIPEVKLLAELKQYATDEARVFLFLYRGGSQQSECALKNLEGIYEKMEGIILYRANVEVVHDIHIEYNITTVPSLLEFNNGKLKNIVKGCNPPEFYKAYFENSLFAAQSSGSNSGKEVKIYTTPTCTYCNALKSHLRKHHIPFQEIDVSIDDDAAEEMVRKSGQRGVPQIEIDSQIIVGFDKKRIDQMLGITE